MEKKERMTLVKEGNAFYEVDEICMQKGMNRRKEENVEKIYQDKKHRGTAYLKK